MITLCRETTYTRQGLNIHLDRTGWPDAFMLRMGSRVPALYVRFRHGRTVALCGPEPDEIAPVPHLPAGPPRCPVCTSIVGQCDHSIGQWG